MSMVYEWDAKRARRAYLAKIGLSLLAAMVMVAVPAWVAIAMTS
ncbi:Hypothetical protein NGAL_HAMBI1145_03940 [Neorhizobium galegae bv. officinalis]|jgi:hypothetical protein|uniref:Uncharacterized protein n=1 Tax=Neorhizobium galegae bv. officinalis TaxID=323656 RepID=A0A0T7GB28_NEOGA|nr:MULTISPECIES: hypothetical protein [Neorhizobium]CDZ31631.1 Hypothetical protein NGAL_HAMBI1145_03940 [Neorhizobium galegae bv. officinalis]CDZ44469.1 Hypothetical protein NGAL_HAMBI1189_04090 [Neorhizobium galegae bv. officinalis]